MVSDEVIFFGFNPCFNGFMDKCWEGDCYHLESWVVSTLVLMDSWINAPVYTIEMNEDASFNPCFNGFMDKCECYEKDTYPNQGFQPLF